MIVLAESWFDASFLDRWELPVGTWAKEAVFWLNNNVQWLLDAIAWPFQILLDVLVDGFLLNIPWLLVVLGFLVIGTATRNFMVGLGAALGLFICGLLGFGYWEFTVKTIGMIVVAVIVSTAFGIPIGIASARNDRVWNAIRPLLDGMQVIHPFVYLIPVIFFWGTGPLPGTIATMVFALPPIVRLTNLGIRQVPSEVVEASRAFGASEWRVLSDVQLPLARPAIMTGLNQTLLMALSMVGIVAVIAGGGLGQLILRGVNTTNIPLAVSSGLALYLVGVVLDRISQPEGGVRRPLWRRILDVWAGRARDISVPPMPAPQQAAEPVTPTRQPLLAPSGRLGAAAMVAGGAGLVVSAFLAWGYHAGLLTSYVRPDDTDLNGQALTGLMASGGSWFAIFSAVAGIVAIGVGLGALLSRLPGRGWPKWLSAQVGIIAGLTATVLPIAYLAVPELASQPAADGALVPLGIYQDGIGVFIALIGGVAVTVGSLLYAAAQRLELWDESVRPASRLVGTVTLGLVVVAAGVFSSWIFDERRDPTLDPEIQAQIEALQELGTAEAAAQITLLATRDVPTISISGLESGGPQLGFIALAVAAAALVASGVRARAAMNGTSLERRWLLDTMVLGLGLAVVALALAWVLAVVSVADRQVIAGIGTFITLIGGSVIAIAVLPELRRVRATVEGE